MKEVLNIARKCRSCLKAKCQQACPLSQNIPLITKLINNNDIVEAYNILSMHNPFGYVTSILCNHEKQCAGNCLFKEVDFYHIENKLSTLYFNQTITYPSTLEDKKIAIIGGGIAGLTLAHSLLKQGIKPTIYEKNQLGGVIISAIPEFRFDKTLFKQHIKEIEKRANVIYQEVTLENLNVLNNYEHVIFTTGAEIENRALSSNNVLQGIEVLKSINNNACTLTNKKLAVIGLGNTACDVARSLARLYNDVKIIYRRDVASSPATLKELSALKEENIAIKECYSPVSFEDNILRMQKNILIDNPGTSRKSFVQTEEFTEEQFDYVIEALGSKANDTLLKAILEEDYHLLEESRNNKDSRSVTILHNNQKVSVIGDAYYGAWNIAHAINSSLEVVKRNYPTYLFGGSFNPITKAHAKIIEYLSTLGSVIIVPNGDKYNLKDLMSFDHRKKMIELELSKMKYHERVTISLFEKSTLYKGSIETLRYYNHPIMVIGDDCLLTLHNWINAESLVKENNFLVITRNHNKDDLVSYIEKQEILKAYKDNFKVIELLDEDTRQMSSTSYRSTNNQDVISLEVMKYIKNNNLYEV